MLGASRRTSSQVEAAWVAKTEARADLRGRVERGAALRRGGMSAVKAAKEVGTTAHMVRTHKQGDSPRRTGPAPAEDKCNILAAVASYSRSEQMNGFQFKPKELGAKAASLLNGETGGVAHTTVSLKKASRQAARLARGIHRFHLGLGTRSLSEHIVEEARDRWTTEENVKCCTAG